MVEGYNHNTAIIGNSLRIEALWVAILSVAKLSESRRLDFECTNQEYMYNFAARYYDLTGKVVWGDSPENFLADLLAFGYATVK